MTNAGRFLSAIILTSFLSAVASAQSEAQNPKDQQPPPQSANQIVGDQKPLGVKTFAKADSTGEKKSPDSQPSDAQYVVIPPAPLVVRKDSAAVSIPAALANAESKYEERAAVSSSVSVGSGFGYRRDPFTRRAKFHSGADIKARWGDAVGASQAGVVTFAGWYHGYGNMIVINHGGGVATHYAHLSSFDVEVGTHVERGTIIGRAGSTGRATSPHLHYEVRFDGNALNPFQPLALDPSSEYFKQTRPSVDAGRGDATSPAGSQQNN